MSPILKRDVSETVRQARRLATAVTGATPGEDDDDPDDRSHDSYGQASKWDRPTPDNVFSSGADRRKGIGVENGDVGWEPSVYAEPRHRQSLESPDGSSDVEGEEEEVNGRRSNGKELLSYEADAEGERSHMLGSDEVQQRRGWLQELEYEEPLLDASASRSAQLRDLRNLLLGVSGGLPVRLSRARLVD
jgi:hypothetical protein